MSAVAVRALAARYRDLMLVSLMTCASFFLYVNWRFSTPHAPSPILTELLSQPLLRNLEIIAGDAQLSPAFDPYQVNYQLQVNYDQLVIQLRASVFTDEVTLIVEGSPLQTDQWLNYTCGAGETSLSIHLTSKDTTRVLNNYVINVSRMRHQPPTNISSLNVCQLLQDCDMRIDQISNCGLETIPGRTKLSWSSYWALRQHLPLCKNGFSTEARWLVPCESCSTSTSCVWDEARWTYPDCQYVKTPRVVLQQCLSNTKILFLGDSTLRGMMYEAVQQLNGSLARWEKSHDVAVYNQTNRGNTLFAFAYYPKFWRRKLPSFDMTLKRLIERVPASRVKGEDMILVLGGVHWLSKTHMDAALKLLSEQGLYGVRIVVKTLGAGFHQRVHGVHFLPKEGLRKIISHNQQIITASLQRGFAVVDTLRMTYARYKDFTEGKCACHFHKVVKIRTNLYQVEGSINRQYTNMMLQTLCSRN